jgi:hypothetical protein
MWYEYPGFFESPVNFVDYVVRTASEMLGLPQRRLTILHESRGVIFGAVCVSVTVASKRLKINLSDNAMDGSAVPTAICHQLVGDGDVTIRHNDRGVSLNDCIALVSDILLCFLLNL